MPNLHIALRCAIFVFVLFSCNTKKNQKAAEENFSSSSAEIIKAVSQEQIDISSLHAKFIDGITQHFSVSSKRVSTLKAKAGLKIKVNPSLLEREDGAVLNGNIDVSVIELTNVNDLFRANAATISNGRLLASGGSYFLGMENCGIKLKIKSGKTIDVEFPMLKNEDMELFYGKRDEYDNMNWQPAEKKLKYESVSFIQNSGWDELPVQPFEEIIKPKVYKSLDEPVYFYNQRMTLSALVDTINKKEAKVYLKTISFWPIDLPTDQKLDTNYLTLIYGPRQQYILKAFKNEQKEKEVIEKQNAIRQTAIAKWQPKSLAGQLQKYYRPSDIKSLGWLNCDRFYEMEKKENTEIELPYALNNTHVNYFILFKSFNGLLGGNADVNGKPKFSLQGIPSGEEVTFIAFIKKNGIIYQAKEDFVVGKNKINQVNFKEISATDISKMFGSNIKI